MTENSDVSPQETFERLMSEAIDARRKRSLEAIHETCRLLSEKRTSDFSYKNIVAHGKELGFSVPSEKSIVNATGKHYRELIHAWRLSSLPSVSKKKTANTWIDEIKDPVLRMSVLMLANEVVALKNKIARSDKFSGLTINLGEGRKVSVESVVPRLNEIELAALKAAIDPDDLSKVGLSIGSRGELVDAKGKKLFRPGFRDALEKILSVHD